jgi:group I intron endonuclease
MIGIYKITNPKGKIYIGQSINLELRVKEYKKLLAGKNQRKLYNSLLKYGPESHIFEIIETCEIELLNNRERFWQDYYDVLNKGLNLKLTPADQKLYEVSRETKNKISNSLKKHYANLTETQRNEIYGKSSRKRKGIKSNRKYFVTESTKAKLSEKLKGRIVKKETKNKIRERMCGRTITWGAKISEKLKGKPNLKNKGKNITPILQFDLNDNLIQEWESITLASKTLGIKFNTISNNVCGYTKTTKQYVWKYKFDK